MIRELFASVAIAGAAISAAPVAAADDLMYPDTGGHSATDVPGMGAPWDDLLRAIRTVASGQSLLDPSVTSAVLDRLRSGKHLLKDEKLARLSPQEERILSAIAQGRTNREIADELHLAEKTVKNYVSAILSKLEVARRAEAAAYLARHTVTPGSVE